MEKLGLTFRIVNFFWPLSFSISVSEKQEKLVAREKSLVTSVTPVVAMSSSEKKPVIYMMFMNSHTEGL